MRLSLFHARHYYFHRLFERQNRWGCVGKSARAPNFLGCLLECLEKYWNLEEPSTFCESWHRGGHGGVLGSSRFVLLLIFDF